MQVPSYVWVPVKDNWDLYSWLRSLIGWASTSYLANRNEELIFSATCGGKKDLIFSCQSAEKNFINLGGYISLRSWASGGVNTSLVFVGKQCARCLYWGLSQGHWASSCSLLLLIICRVRRMTPGGKEWVSTLINKQKLCIYCSLIL